MVLSAVQSSYSHTTRSTYEDRDAQVVQIQATKDYTVGSMPRAEICSGSRGRELMRRNPRVDANHSEIIKALRDVGALVYSTAALGNGFPDILVGFRGQLFMFEIKDPSKPPSHRRLTPDEEKFHMLWRDHVRVVETVEQALKAITERKS